MRNAAQLTSKIRNIVDGLDPHDKSTGQMLLTTYFNGRLLEQLANSPYRDNFILKGGYLLENMTSADNRTTADIDLTVDGMNDDKASMQKVVDQVFSTPTDDGIEFENMHLKRIRQEATYPGIRILGQANFGRTRSKVKIDVTTGDAIYGGPVDFTHRDIVDGHEVKIRAYSAEQMVAEKLQTTIEKSTDNTRAKDFYDVDLLTSDRNIAPIDYKKVAKAFKAVSDKKGTVSDSARVANVLRQVSESDFVRDQWDRFVVGEGRNYVGQLDFDHAISSVQRSFHRAELINQQDNIDLYKSRQADIGRRANRSNNKRPPRER